jgi:phage terminase large subunit
MIKNLRIETPEWAEPLLSPARYKGIYGGRGSGKSHERAEAAIEKQLIDPNSRGVCIREFQKSLDQSVKQLLEDKIQKLGVGDYFTVQDAKILSKRGEGHIIFQGMQNHTAESIKSLEGYDWAWVEEAQSLSQRSLDLLRPTIRQESSELWFTWNPGNPTDPIDMLLRSSNPPPNSTIIQVNYMDNPWFPDVLREEMEYDMKRDIEKYRHVWLGGYVQNSEKRVFKNWKVQEFDTPSDVHLRFGADWGYAVDPTTLVRCWIDGRKLYVDYEAYQIGCEIVNTPELFLTVPEAEKWPIVADSARPETISHMQKNGFPKIIPAVKGPGSVEDGIEWLKSYEIIVHPRCKHVINELTHYSWKTDKNTEAILPILEDKHNHVIDGLRYACENVRRIAAAKPVKKIVYYKPTGAFG